MDPIVEVVARRFLDYAFKDIKYKYYELTPEEKALCSEEEFQELVKWIKK